VAVRAVAVMPVAVADLEKKEKHGLCEIKKGRRSPR
jgi:hypothetical protein